MSKNPLEACRKCFNPFPLYATTCPACKWERWKHWFEFAVPDPATGEYCAHRRIELTDGLRVYDADQVFEARGPSVPVQPRERGLVLIVIGTGPDGSLETMEKPFGDTVVKPVRYFWSRTDRVADDIPDDRFPPTSSNARMAPSVPKPNANRNAWLFDQYVNHPNKTLTAIRSECNQKNGWGKLGSDTALRKCVKSHSDSFGIDMPIRNNKRTKPQ